MYIQLYETVNTLAEDNFMLVIWYVRKQSSFPEEKAEQVVHEVLIWWSAEVSANKVMKYGLQLAIKSQLTFLVCIPLEIRISKFLSIVFE